MATKYFRKALVSNPVYIKGTPVPFEVLAGNSGLIALDDVEHAILCEGLTTLSQQRKAGVVEIPEAEYEDLKKKRRSGVFAQRSVPQAQVLRPVQPFKMPDPLGGRSQNAKAAAVAPVAGADKLRGHLASKAQGRQGVGPNIAVQKPQAPQRGAVASSGNKVAAAVSEAAAPAKAFSPKLSPAPIVESE